jgi:hypothetical protein
MTPEQFIYWLKGYLADKSVAADVNIIKDELDKIDFGRLPDLTPPVIDPSPWTNPWTNPTIQPYIQPWYTSTTGTSVVNTTDNITVSNTKDKTKTVLND